MQKLKGTFLLLVCCTTATFSQEHAWVYFTDKDNVDFALNNPMSILSERALQRKAKFAIAIDESDVPVNENYIAELKSQNGITVKAKSKWFNCAHVTGAISVIEALKTLPFIARIDFADKRLNAKQQAVFSYRKLPDNHTEKTKQVEVNYNYGSTETQVKQLKTNVLHVADFTGDGIWIAVMDGGFPNVDQLGAFERLRSQNKLLGGYDFVDRTQDIFRSSGDGHGTNVLSDMAGFIENQFVGTAPDAAYILFRTEDVATETPVEESYWVEAAERADSLGVNLINTSLGYSTFDNPAYNYTPAQMDGQTTFISKGATTATEKGMLVVVSAGNTGASATWNIITAPADANVFAVGAVNAMGNYAGFSSRGPNADGRIKPDGMAMGVNAAIITTNNSVGTANGTSFASPILAGAMACLWQAFPDKSNLELMQLVRESSSLYTNPTSQMGFGIPNFETALSALEPPEIPVVPQVPEISDNATIFIFPNPGNQAITIQLTSTLGAHLVTVFDIYGKLVLQKQLTQGDNEIPVVQLSNALYIVHVEGSEGIKKFKFIKN
ncbi:S8 family serine peptidase [Arenibacter sp. GZD96]|uniref:S8 family serine peptidase n=1 Tax=Aurantibrevibacter litoralis TaxID=3106030 RepID=UPI002AFFD720|nr:S8 family serine peptidase [Arenibacter sp. GZD-96]MEA1784975.1 S8 family serine peptidase [Arenibacter sp. GZD-96]